MNWISEDRQDRILVLLTCSRGAESRKKILEHLILGPKNCNQLAKVLDLDWWTIQKHLKILMTENIVKEIDFGRRKLYKLTCDGEKTLAHLFDNEKNINKSRSYSHFNSIR